MRESLERVRARRGTITLSHQIIDLVLRQERGPGLSPEETLALIDGFFDAGDATPPPPPDGSASPADSPSPRYPEREDGPRPAPTFVEWLMGLEPGWVTDPDLGLTQAQQLAALGNGVVWQQAGAALRALAALTGLKFL